MLNRTQRAPLSAQAALSAIVVCTVLIVACIAAVSWVLLQHAAPATACALLVPALPVRGPLRRLWLQWRMWCNALRMAETERQIWQYRRLLVHDREHLEQLRERLSAQQSHQLALASEQ